MGTPEAKTPNLPTIWRNCCSDLVEHSRRFHPDEASSAVAATRQRESARFNHSLGVGPVGRDSFASRPSTSLRNEKKEASTSSRRLISASHACLTVYHCSNSSTMLESRLRPSVSTGPTSFHILKGSKLRRCFSWRRICRRALARSV